MTLYMNPRISTSDTLARQCIKESLERRGSKVISIRKTEVMKHEMLEN